MQTPIVPKVIDTFPGTITANRLVVSDTWSKNDQGVNCSYRLERTVTVATVETVTVARADGVYLTTAQWNAWGTGVSDTEYILDCVALNLGLTRA